MSARRCADNLAGVLCMSIAILSGCVTAPTTPLCPDDWHYFEDSCYTFAANRTGMRWLEARVECRSMDSTLVSIGSEVENVYVVAMANKERNRVYAMAKGEIQSNISVGDYFHIGLTKTFKKERGIFRDMFIWEDGSPLTYKNWWNQSGNDEVPQPDGAQQESCVAMLTPEGWHDIGCGHPIGIGFICERRPSNFSESTSAPVLPVAETTAVSQSLYMTCRNGELVSKFRKCDGSPDCVDGSDEHDCNVTEAKCNKHQYRCSNGKCISVSYYCDFFNDCGDNSDEAQCATDPCVQGWSCRNGQCIDSSRRCDLVAHCLDGSDEADCDVCNTFDCYDGTCIPNIWKNDGIVDCNGKTFEDEIGPPEKRIKPNLEVPSVMYPVKVFGRTSTATDAPISCLRIPDLYGKVTSSFDEGNMTMCSDLACPVGFFQCRQSYCIPAYLVCNGIQDCHSGEDETNCESYTCPGLYRCQRSGSSPTHCIHPHELCDGIHHCPLADDESLCDIDCPTNCMCEGLSIVCTEANMTVSSLPKNARRIEINGIDLSGSRLNFKGFVFLQSLLIIRSSLVDVPLIQDCPNLLSLDLSYNKISKIPKYSFRIPSLLNLDLAWNEDLDDIEAGSFHGLDNLKWLNLYETSVIHLLNNTFNELSKLQYMSLSESKLEIVDEGAFSGLSNLKVLDITENEINLFTSHMFNGLDNLQELHAYRLSLCCDGVRPPSVMKDMCYAKNDKISTCSDLIGVGILGVITWVLGIMAVVGNLGVLGFRVIFDREVLNKGYGIFVTNLCIADFLMGVYLLIIADADSRYKGRYVWHAFEWRKSGLCQAGGFLGTFSSEASCLFICLVTLDRFFAIKFPFGQVRFTKKWAIFASALVWILAFTFAAVPLLPAFQDWGFYTQNAMCMGLPFSDDMEPSWFYSFSIFVCFNFLAFLMIACGQIFIYRSISASGIVKDKKRYAQEAAIAKRLFLVVFTDFCCWCPIGVMGIMAANGMEVSDRLYAYTVVIILPINSALNPFLYTLPLLGKLVKTRQHTKSMISRLSTTTESHFKIDRNRTCDTSCDDSIPTERISNEDISTGNLVLYDETKSDDIRNGGIENCVYDEFAIPLEFTPRSNNIHHEATTADVYVGTPLDGMDRLSDAIRAGTVRPHQLHQCIPQLLNLLHNHILKNGHPLAITDDQVFCKLEHEDLTGICLVAEDGEDYGEDQGEDQQNMNDLSFLFNMISENWRSHKSIHNGGPE